MTDVTSLRLWVMRAMYLVMAAGIGATVWPAIVTRGATAPHMTGVAWALIGTIGLLSIAGFRYPLKMIPLLFVELTWKAIWLAAFALPHWQSGTLDKAMRDTMIEVSLGAVLLIVIPWRYVLEH